MKRNTFNTMQMSCNPENTTIRLGYACMHALLISVRHCQVRRCLTLLLSPSISSPLFLHFPHPHLSKFRHQQNTSKDAVSRKDVSHALRDIATFTFDLGGHGACRWYGSSSCFICVPCLKFVDLPVRKILRIYCVSINWPGDFDLWPFDIIGTP